MGDMDVIVEVVRRAREGAPPGGTGSADGFDRWTSEAMSTYDDGVQEPHGDSTDLDKRDVRALTECMTAVPLGGDIFDVTTESGASYRVDAREGRCTCPDTKYNLPTDDGRETCKHVARVRYATGERAIPAYCDPSAVDPLLGQHTDGTPRVARTVAADGGVVVTDDGEPTDGERPDDCGCEELHGFIDLPCWPCYREGFNDPNPNAESDD